MKNITVNKQDLYEALRTNGQKHVADYNAAMEGYWKAAEKAVENLLRQVKNHNTRDEYLHVNLQRPESHEADYDNAIEMLDWHEGPTIEVSQQEFKQFVKDEWSWKKQFAQTTQTYTGAAW